MRKTEQCSSWVVYRTNFRGKTTGMGAICEQVEWEAMQLDKPGHHTLVKAGITNEGEAERMARSIPVDVTPSKPIAPKALQVEQVT